MDNLHIVIVTYNGMSWLSKCLESCKAIQQSMSFLLLSYKYLPDWKVKTPKDQQTWKISALIHYFKLVTEGYTLPKGQTYVRQEAPKGELGLLIVSDNTNKAYRVKIRSPDYYNLQGLNIISFFFSRLKRVFHCFSMYFSRLKRVFHRLLSVITVIAFILELPAC